MFVMKQKYKKIAAIILAVSLLGGCTAPAQPGGDEVSTAQSQQSSEISATEETQSKTDISSDTTEVSLNLYMGRRPMLIGSLPQSVPENATPQVAQYSVEPDLSNIENLKQLFYGDVDDEFAQKLSQNGFVVEGNAGREFFEVYEINRYQLIPNFVTVDSLMHTYHLYFSYLLKNIERDYLFDSLVQLSDRMLENSLAQYDALKGSEWESAAKRNVAFFTIGRKLLDDSTEVSPDVADIVQSELDKIQKAEGIAVSEIRNDEEDYSQYVPRGYYEGDEKLEKYFKAMMWYGRIHFQQDSEDHVRSAFLITKALADDEEATAMWGAIYSVTAFFAGASDDLGVCEYAPLISEVYGDTVGTTNLIGTQDTFSQFYKKTADLPAPKINSIPIYEWEDSNVIPGFRFMGQRFTIDGEIMQNLIYRNVDRNSAGEKRMLPDVLDVLAALGSDTALSILKESGVEDYEHYPENMEKLRTGLAEENDELWAASLYASWLHTLRPLLTEKGEGYPVFMQNEEWTKKSMECFAGSYAELKHDTILYSKQVIAEMGGDYFEEIDDRGYVEPEPLVYARFMSLADMTAQGLKKYEMLSAEQEENLSRLTQIADQMYTISNKELQDELLTDDEYEFIRSYGGNIEHFWYEAVKGESDEEYIATQECPAAIIADIATDPDSGSVLEVGTGDPSYIFVVIQVDGKIKLAKGSVYSFYQFTWPIDDRLTDSKWRQMLGIQPNEEGNYEWEQSIEQPDWTRSYRYKYVWE
ncbi:MAG: DUF3160 domain-containing protein [Lachnospiraceae bacterium]|nr:DUF3160 domain-containing protein [Lachnospiraceae bacterium]